MTPLVKTCVRCKKHLPADAFRKNRTMKSGLHSWCKACGGQNLREWRRAHRNGEAGDNEVKATYADPLSYSRRHCLHIAEYAERVASRFEQKTGKESPPHLTAIADLARSLALQHPEGSSRPYPTLKCEVCGASFTATRKDGKFCAPCRGEGVKQREAARYQRRKADPEWYAARLAHHREWYARTRKQATSDPSG